jgi:hypothetical protein
MRLDEIDCSRLPPVQRAQCYLDMADQVERRAERATTETIRTSYLKLAQEWRELADTTLSPKKTATVPVSDGEWALAFRHARGL